MSIRSDLNKILKAIDVKALNDSYVARVGSGIFRNDKSFSGKIPGIVFKERHKIIPPADLVAVKQRESNINKS